MTLALRSSAIRTKKVKIPRFSRANILQIVRGLADCYLGMKLSNKIKLF